MIFLRAILQYRSQAYIYVYDNIKKKHSYTKLCNMDFMKLKDDFLRNLFLLFQLLCEKF